MRKIKKKSTQNQNDLLSIGFFGGEALPDPIKQTDSKSTKKKVCREIQHKIRGVLQQTLWQEDNFRVVGELKGLRTMQKLNISSGKWYNDILPEDLAIKAFNYLRGKQCENCG